MEARLDALEKDPAFQAMADLSDEDFRQRRFLSHDKVKEQVLVWRNDRKL